jgi:hypothetical protein
MEYCILFYETPETAAERDDPAKAPAYWGAWSAYIQAVRESGLMRGGAGLQPPATATALRLKAGKRHFQDGPLIDAKEQLGGFIVLEVPDLDAALAWAARSPSASRAGVEVRPVLPPMK